MSRMRIPAIVAAAVLVVPAAAAADDDLSDGLDLSGVGDLTRYISDIRTSVTDIRLRTPTDIERTEEDGEETVIALDSDILFGFDKAEISPNAASRITEIIADIPDGTALKIGGHTDSLGSDERNQELSTERAEAVAAVIREARPTMDLTVEGFGHHEPVADNTRGGEDNPEGRALNRRVEIRYAD